MTTLRRLLRPTILVLLASSASLLLSHSPAAAEPPRPPADLHAPFDSLLARYLRRDRVYYMRWWADDRDKKRLSGYIDNLETQIPSMWGEADQKAYWINLYNATAIELVLEHYPINSIKDAGDLIGRPFARKVLRVEGKEISLGYIEGDVLRKRFPDGRVHFALNCAAISCPPLRSRTYAADSIDVQLDEVTRRALQDPRFAQVNGRQLYLSKLFDWYKSDFEHDAGSVEAFLARYRDDVPVGPKIKYERHYFDYDWALNEAR